MGTPSIQCSTDHSERFTFTGKERDEETGYSYFSARYLDNEIMTSFLSVDRYAFKYPFISPYAYCAWNPMKLIDPTGDGGTHYMCYLAVISSPLFKSTTTLYQNFNYNMLNHYFQ